MFKQVVEAYRAWRRNETRTAPGAVRGRIYAKNEESTGGGINIPVEPEVQLEVTITRADGSVERMSLPASATPLEKDQRNG